ncbi:MAG TPA: YitT family protein [Phototrophicaceae bacterium]|nr:YitT family protein [Phototrophicaceae bacterium]
MSVPTPVTLPFNLRSFMFRFILITAGTLIGSFAVVVFMAPFNIAPAGVTGVAVIMNIKLGTPIGLIVLLGNIPIQYFAYRMLGGWKIIAWTIYVLVLYAVAVDFLKPIFPVDGVSDDVLLNAIFGGIIGGIGSGLVYRAGANFGGTSTLAQVFQRMNGLPLSTTYLYANLLSVGLAGIVLGWQGALYAMVALALEGATSDYVLEGPSVIRTAVIITDYPREVADGILYQMKRGVTSWQATGMFTGQTRTILYVTVARFQIGTLRDIVATIDPGAFIVIGQGHVAFGEGFKPVAPSRLSEDPTRH